MPSVSAEEKVPGLKSLFFLFETSLPLHPINSQGGNFAFRGASKHKTIPVYSVSHTLCLQTGGDVYLKSCFIGVLPFCLKRIPPTAREHELFTAEQKEGALSRDTLMVRGRELSLSCAPAVRPAGLSPVQALGRLSMPCRAGMLLLLWDPSYSPYL